MNTKPKLRILLILEGSRWTAQCLDVNVAFQFERLSDLNGALIQALRAHLEIFKEVGYGSQDQLPKASQRYFEMYENAIPLGVHIDNVVAGLLGDCGDSVEVESETKMCELASCK